ncbi:nucleotidyltransferase domain-containing protein [Marinobacter daepoensis]|uniref:Nucleotidyltransferase domain-containing protein n=1 Tax=Marinobacter daepoensis TaxID=262077 RepID=A0ABS3BAX1_9GAMM|nr:nucleotidyltransferase domain-containing protein [Marinobacter daepoensis]MBN7768746.1 nucleotidyltransferase domain-containing protein [Marinobacter daepoensis]MBY6079483.1 nucleotidyltransferase domain-containing protein [Marinobacter daepoensis]
MPGTSIGDALFTKTQQRLLSLIYGHPEQSYYLNELVRLANIGRGTVVRELAKLTDAGLVVMAWHGNQKHYQANPENPVFQELRQLVQKTFGISDVIQNALLPMADTLEQAFIYGSIAKGDAHAGSDIDLMLIGHDLSYSDVMTRLAPAEQQLQRTINPTLYSPSEFEQRIKDNQSFVTRVLEQPRIELRFNH